MARKNGIDVVLHERDREIFRFVGEHETATFDQIRQKFWPGSTSPKTARDRLTLVYMEGFIMRYPYIFSPTGRSIRRYSITRRAATLLEGVTTARLYVGKLIDREVEAALKGVAARLELERRGYDVVGWISERELGRAQHRAIEAARMNGRLAMADAVSDGQALIRDGETGAIRAIDVEIDGQYWGRMLDEKVAAFADRPVFWVCPASRVVRVTAAATPNITVINL